MAPPYGQPPAAPAPEPAAQDGGRRGKPKRRRFNFNVLENLEKMVQARSEPLPPTGWTPPVVAPPIPAAPAPVVPPPAPAVEAASSVKEPPAEAPSLLLPFGPSVEDAPDTTEPESAATETDEASVADEAEEPAVASEAAGPSAVSQADEASAATEAEAPSAEGEDEPETQPTSPPAPPRKSMREMLFGEEAPAAAEAEPTAEPTQSEPEPASAEWSWRPTRWEPAEDTSSTPARETAAKGPAADEPVVDDEPVVEDAPEAVPVAEANEPEPFAPWTSSVASESLFESEPTKADADQERSVGYPQTPTSDTGSGPSAGTVVIIEDDETAASYYATLFRGNGYRVEVANDGVSGVDLCTRVQPQVILLDVMMPRQNGILVLQTLRASDETKNTPVVVMSNFSEPTLIKRAIQLGALEYVIKTQVEGTALLNAMPRWMNREKAFAAA
jgi:CheY-like chemotaxis protein